MVTVSEASAIILDHLFVPGTDTVRIQESVGKVLAEAVTADRDFPPFDRVAMDGIAIQYREWNNGRRAYSIAGTQAAGEKQKSISDSSHCIEVMTGAVLPEGCDAVIRYEDLEIIDNEATIKVDTVNEWQSIHIQGADAKKNEVLLEPGQVLAASEVALLASVGKTSVRVYTFPKVAIISTGDELVDIHETPNAYQIRRSNAYALLAAVHEMGGKSKIFHLADEKSLMDKSIAVIAEEYDVLILSGGVSKGKFDFVPGVLEHIGIHKLFHQVSQRPGKPFWFGRSDSGKVAFALPGNPVSTFMCFYKYIKPWILKSMGAAVTEHNAVLGKDFTFSNPLTYFLQVSATCEQGRMVAYPVPGGGSGDFANLKNATGFLELPLKKTDFRAGEVFPYISFRH